MTTDQRQLIDRVAGAVAVAGGRALLVGGCVRDAMLGRDVKDIDIEVFGIESDALRILLESFGQVDCVGASFGVYKLAGMDVSIPRRDSKSGHGHKGFVITGDPTMTVEDAAKRRDFTMNAISFDPLTGEFIDPTGGVVDLMARVLRVVDPVRFGDDSLRVLRAVQFAARFDVVPDLRTMDIMRAIDLSDLPAERVWGEFDKLLRAPRPSQGLQVAMTLGVVTKLWPELDALWNTPQDAEWHPEGDVWTHTMHVVDQARRALDADPLPYAQDITVMLAALCHDFGKPATTELIDGRWRALGHEAAGVEPTRTFLDRLNVRSLDNYDVREQVLAIVDHHLLPHQWHKSPPSASAFRRLSRKVDLMLLARVALADGNGRPPKPMDSSAYDWFVDAVRVSGATKPGGPTPLLLGRHLIALGMTPGPAFTPILKAVYEQQLDGTVATVEDAIAAARVKIAEVS